MTERVNPSGRGVSSESGFSIMEAIVALVIASMILAAILPIASRSVRDNVRIGLKGLDAFAMSIEEQAFRNLAEVAIPAPTQPFQPPAKTTLFGDAVALETTAFTPEPKLCVPAGFVIGVRLEIQPRETGGRLICIAEDIERVLLEWESGDPALAYSADGVSWGTEWPVPVQGEAQNAEDPTLNEMGGVGLVSVTAPYVRFTLQRRNEAPLVWIARFGEPRPPEFRMQDLIGSADPVGSPNSPGRRRNPGDGTFYRPVAPPREVVF